MGLDNEEVREIVRKCSERYQDDVPKAVEMAERQIRKLTNFKKIVDSLVHMAVQEMVYDARHAVNVEYKRSTGQYGGKAKVTPGGSEAVKRVERTLYEYRIFGMTLGSVRGDQLSEFAEKAQNLAEGHSFNASLCTKLQGLVPADKTVSEAVTERKLRTIFDRLRKQYGRGAA